MNDTGFDKYKEMALNSSMQGGCFCGATRYEVSGRPFHETNCHCATCRRVSGAPLVAWFTVRRAQFRITRGTPARFRSSDHGSRTFCPHCGTALCFEDDALSDEIDVTICSLDEPSLLPPRDHTWTASRLPWMKPADGLPEYAHARRPEPPDGK